MEWWLIINNSDKPIQTKDMDWRRVYSKTSYYKNVFDDRNIMIKDIYDGDDFDIVRVFRILKSL